MQSTTPGSKPGFSPKKPVIIEDDSKLARLWNFVTGVGSAVAGAGKAGWGLTKFFGKAVDATVIEPVKLARSTANWGRNHENSFIKKTVPITAGLTLAAYFGAMAAGAGVAAYAATYGAVAAGDLHVKVLNVPASEGAWTGRVVRFSKKGIGPCAAYEGRLQIGEASTNYNDFSVRAYQKDIIEQVVAANKSGERVTLKYRDSMWPQSFFSKNIEAAHDGDDDHDPRMPFGCILHTDHTPVSVSPATPMTPAR